MLSDAVSQWPQPVPAQVLRSRLQAYTELLTDADFVQGVCACCARAKRRVKLRPALFPTREAPEPPAWLNVSLDDWQCHGEAWWDAVDAILKVDNYLQN